MAKAKRLNVTFDGVNDVKTGRDGIESFYSNFMWLYNLDTVAKFTATLTGSDWIVFSLSAVNWGNKGLKSVISDADDGAGRQINVLDVGYNSKVTLQTTSVLYLEGHDGALHDVTLGSGYYKSVTLNADKNILKTGSGRVEHIQTGQGDDVVKTGSGGVDFITTGAGNDVVKIGSGGVNSITTGDGNDTIFTSGNINSITTGAGDDVVTTRSQYISYMHLGAGDDKVVVAEMGAWYELRVAGSSNPKNGVDTMDFSKLTKGVTIKIGSSGEWQEIYKSKAIDAYVSETGMENVIGTKFRDFLSSGGKDNELTGGKGKDVFIFGKNTGNDTVMDFVEGTDILRIKGHKGGFAALDIVGGDIVLDGGSIDLVGIDASTLTADSFQFI